MACPTSAPSSQMLASKMTLFELDETLSLLMESATEAASENNDELPEELRQALLNYCEAFGTKVDNIANYIKSQENEARSAKLEVDRLESRRAAAENKIEGLKGLLKYFMQTWELCSMKGRLNTIALRKNSQDSLVVDRADIVPAEYWRVSFTLALPELEELLRHLPEGHTLQARLLPDRDGVVRRELDNAKLRTALASGVSIQGAELRRGHHVRLT
jgi:Siphovirus Gp157